MEKRSQPRREEVRSMKRGNLIKRRDREEDAERNPTKRSGKEEDGKRNPTKKRVREEGRMEWGTQPREE